MSPIQHVPYVIGQWVKGRRFYGRRILLETLLAKPGQWSWVAGLRRIGKTSLLRQIEHRVETSHGKPHRERHGKRVAFHWDVQGVDRIEELAPSLSDALFDAEENLGRAGIDVDRLDSDDPFAILHALATKPHDRGIELLVLIDEADELRALHNHEPGILARLWPALAGTTTVKVILASSIKLCDFVATDDALATHFAPFGTPHFLGPLTDHEARALVCQDQLAAESRPAVSPKESVELARRFGNHPMLVQMAAKRFLEVGSLEEAARQISSDLSVHRQMAVDFALLNPTERQAVRALATSAPLPTHTTFERLTALGITRRGPTGHVVLAHEPISAWLAAESAFKKTSPRPRAGLK